MESPVATPLPSPPRPRTAGKIALILALLAVPAVFLDLGALPLRDAIQRVSQGRSWPKEVLNPLRGMGTAGAAILAMGLMALLDPPRLRKALFGGLSLGAGGLVVQFAKALTGRARPDENLGIATFQGPGMGGIFNDDYGSLPSGHTATAFGIATILSMHYPRGRWAFFGLAAGCGFARVAEGRHFPSDVYIGALIGIFSAQILLELESRTCRPTATAS
jgi:membrane-associated phospholipid phosphatase